MPAGCTASTWHPLSQWLRSLAHSVLRCCAAAACGDDGTHTRARTHARTQWAFVGWSSEKQRDSLKSFIDATPQGKFNIIDMSVNGEGEWKKWDNGETCFSTDSQQPRTGC